MQTTKRLDVIRGGSLFPDPRKKDVFNSVVHVLGLDNDTPIYSNFQINTDFKAGYSGGILAEGVYAWICGFRQDSGKKVLYFFDSQYFDKINTSKELTEQMRTLPSLIQNPNHDNDKKISCVLFHADAEDGGNSQGCFTMQKSGWINFIDLFMENEKGYLRLTRAADWKAPEYYGGC